MRYLGRASPRLWATIAIAVACTYVSASIIAYGLAHPELTETQRFLRLWQALTWSWE